jgi:hypothetical protein
MSSDKSLNLSPKVFASYAWSDERSAMVREVCERLRSDNVSVLLDQWHLKEGDDVYYFMEKCVSDSTVTAVLLFCDKLYGRTLTDDVQDAFLAILTNGKVTEDKVGPHGDLLAEFPYLGS